jgi:hypothetical protein
LPELNKIFILFGKSLHQQDEQAHSGFIAINKIFSLGAE